VDCLREPAAASHAAPHILSVAYSEYGECPSKIFRICILTRCVDCLREPAAASHAAPHILSIHIPNMAVRKTPSRPRGRVSSETLFFATSRAFLRGCEPPCSAVPVSAASQATTIRRERPRSPPRLRPQTRRARVDGVLPGPLARSQGGRARGLRTEL
jgi:hypothetical protein